MGRVLPILFNTDMVLAILDDRKTTTRRVIKKSQCNGLAKIEPREWSKECLQEPWRSMTDKEFIKSLYNPPCRRGDILYVREAWAQIKDVPNWDKYSRPNGKPIIPAEYVYRADNMRVDGILPEIKWHPSIHMPKEAARIWLEVTDVRVERLQDITEEQAKAEGAAKCYEEINPNEEKPVIYEAEDDDGYYTVGFKAIWNSTVDKGKQDRYGWAANPWVWVIEFEPCKKPESER